MASFSGECTAGSAAKEGHAAGTEETSAMVGDETRSVSPASGLAKLGVADGPIVDGGDVKEEGSAQEKKKKKRKKKKRKKKNATEKFESWCAAALQAFPSGAPQDPAEALAMPPEFNGYTFSGALRPACVTPQRTIPDGIAMPDYALHPNGASRSEEADKRGSGRIHVHTAEEIDRLRVVCKLGREVMEIAGKYLKVGVTGDEIDRIVHAACVERKCYPSPLNYYCFPKSVCVSPNEVICHGIPDCRPIEDGDIVNLDITVYKDGFHADLNETFMVGNVDADSVHLVKTAYKCLSEAAKMIRPGTMYRDLGATITYHASKAKCAVNRTYCGHGIGALFHTKPNVPHYKKNKAVGIMRPGHVFTIEPMINFGGKHQDRTWPDNWTAVTSDGNRSAQFEHTFVVTETGCEILTARPGASITEMVWDETAVRR